MVVNWRTLYAMSVFTLQSTGNEEPLTSFKQK